MNHSAKGSSKFRTGMTAFVILLSGAGAGVYAYVGPNSTTLTGTALHREWRLPGVADKQLLAVPPCNSDAMHRETCRRYMMRLNDKNQFEAQLSSKIQREQLSSLSASDKQKLLVTLALWRVKS